MQPDDLDFVVKMTPNTCKGSNDGRIFVTAQGGNGSYQWKKDYGVLQSATQLEYNNVRAGFYTITLQDAKGCQLSKIIEVTEPDYLQATLDITHVSCKGGHDAKFTVKTTGGNAPFVYSLDNIQFTSIPTFTGLAKSTGQVYFKDAKGCEGLVKYVINEPTQLDIAFISVEPVICTGEHTGTIIPYVTGGTPPYRYSRNGTDFQTANRLENFSVGMYEIIIQDALGCTVATQVEVTEPEKLLQAQIGQVEKSVCGGATGSLTVQVTGGVKPYQFLWDDAKKQTTATAKNLEAGIYTVIITDAYGCQVQVVHQVEDAQGPQVSGLHRWQHPTCYGAQNGVIHLQIENGAYPFTATWKNKTNPDQDLSQYTNLRAEGLGAGEYLILIEDKNGCTTSATIPLRQPDSLILETVEVSHLTCFNIPTGTLQLQAQGGTSSFTYYLQESTGKVHQNRTGQFNALSTDNYQVWVEDRFRCQTTPSTIQIQQPPLLQVQTVQKVHPSCAQQVDGQITIEVQGGVAPYTYQWNTGQTQALLQGVGAGTYEVLVTDAQGCQVTLTETLTQPTPLEIANFGATTPACHQGCDATAFVAVKGGTAPYTYQWNDAQKQIQPTATGLCAGIYEVTITDAQGCHMTQAITIAPTPKLTLDVTQKQEITCFDGCNGQLQIQAQGGTGQYTYSWSHDENLKRPTASNLCPGTYTITVRDEKGCQVQIEMTLTQPAPLQSALKNLVYSCNDKGVTLEAGKAWSGYIWENEAGEALSTRHTLENATAGTYTLYTFNEEGCMLTDQVEVRQSDQYFVGNFAIQTVAEVGEAVYMADISWPKPETIHWNITGGATQRIAQNEYSQTVAFQQPGEYTVGLTAQVGECQDYVEKTIEVYPPAQAPEAPQVVELQEEILVMGLYPNPNSGRFTVGIRLQEAQDVTLKVYGLYAPGMVLAQRNLTGQRDYEVPFDLRLPAGAYILTIQTPNTIKHISFIKE